VLRDQQEGEDDAEERAEEEVDAEPERREAQLQAAAHMPRTTPVCPHVGCDRIKTWRCAPAPAEPRPGGPGRAVTAARWSRQSCRRRRRPGHRSPRW
jgi:hypothetical protein